MLNFAAGLEMDNGSERREATRVLARVGAVGIELSVAICLGLFAGDWADARYGTSPWLTLLGLALGSAVSVRILVGLARAMSANDDDAGTPRG